MVAPRLENARTRAALLLPETCAIRRNTPISDGYGGQTDSWATASTVSARIAATGRTPAERAIAHQVQAAVPYTIVLPHDANVRAGDRLTIGARTFEVLGVVTPSYAVAQRAVSVELA